MKATPKPPFRERIQVYSARQIADATGCALPTAYDWRSGRRAPPAFLRDKLITDIQEHAKGALAAEAHGN